MLHTGHVLLLKLDSLHHVVYLKMQRATRRESGSVRWSAKGMLNVCIYHVIRKTKPLISAITVYGSRRVHFTAYACPCAWEPFS